MRLRACLLQVKCKSMDCVHIKNCKYCGKEFETSNDRKIYCSDVCSQKYGRENFKDRREKYKVDHKKEEYRNVCPVCGNQYVSNTPQQIYCSFKCKDYQNKKERKAKLDSFVSPEYKIDHDKDTGRPFKNLYGLKFGKITVAERIKNGNRHLWKCICECGNVTYKRTECLTSGNYQSCGCTNKIDGRRNERLFKIYLSIKQRCYNNKSASYKNYGGRGIVMCNEWLEDYLNFKDWSLNNGYEENLSIDRIDNDGNYCPENCQWITLSENVTKSTLNNPRKKPKENYIFVNNETKQYYLVDNINRFCKENGLNSGTVTVVISNYYRGRKYMVYKNWSIYTEKEFKKD